MIVVDANVVVYYLMDTPQAQLAQRVLDADPNWHVPLLWRAEFRNAAAQYMRSGRLTLQGALDAVESAEQMLSDNEHAVDSARVMRLVADSQCSAYDCEYVALALRLGVPLVTADRRVLREFPDIAISPDAFIQSTA